MPNLYRSNIYLEVSFSHIALTTVAIIVVICFGLILFGLFHKPKPIALSSLNVRVYSYNGVSQEFRFFDKNNLSNMRSYSSAQFYAQFITSDQEKIKTWLKSIENGEVVSESIQVNVKIKSNSSSLPSMLEYTSYKDNTKLIHFESYIVPHLSKINIDFKANIGYRRFYILENIDKSISSRTIALNVGNTYASTLKHFIAFSVKVPYVKVALSITLSTYCDNNVRKALSQNESMVNLIINDFKTDKVVLYDQNILNKNNVEQTNLRDIKMLIKNSTFRLYFEPTLDILKSKQSFYSLKFTPYGTSMQTFGEVLMFCEKMPGANESIYNSVFEKIRTRITDENSKDILVKLPLSQISTFIDTFNQNYSDLDIHWIIGIREKELVELINEIHLALDFVKLIHEKNCKFAIYFNEATTILPRGLLAETDYFIFDKEINEALVNADLQPNLRLIRSNLSVYKGKICFLNLKTIADIELFAHYCGTIFHCDELKLRSSTLEALDYDKIKLVVSQTKHFIPQNSNISIDMYKDLSQQKDVFSSSDEVSPKVVKKKKKRG